MTSVTSYKKIQNSYTRKLQMDVNTFMIVF